MHSLHKRHLFIAFLLLFTLVVNAAVALVNIRRLVRNERAVARTYLVLSELENVLSLAKDAETSQRGYILTGDERYLLPFRSAEKQISGSLDALAKNIIDAEQKQVLPRLRSEVRQRFQLARQGILLRRTQGIGAAQKFIALGQGRREMDAIRDDVELIQSREQEVLQERAEDSRDSAENAIRTFWIASGANILLLLLVSALLWRASKQNAQLERAYADLQRAESMRDGLSAMLVHDLRTPMTTLLGPLQMLHSETLGPLNESQREVVSMSHYSGERLLKLVNELLDISKMEAGELKVHGEALQLSAVVEAAIREVVRIESGEAVRVVNNVSAQFPPVHGDNDLIIRVMINLIGNALKFTSSGGLVTIGARVDGKNAVVRVSDTGEGIPASDLDKIFDKFGQVETRQAGRKFSTGLGLTFCRLAVEAHGGQIWVESEVGQGSSFFFSLPLHTAG